MEHEARVCIKSKNGEKTKCELQGNVDSNSEGIKQPRMKSLKPLRSLIIEYKLCKGKDLGIW